jgi:NADH-quinone oxidoreductase subunit A
MTETIALFLLSGVLFTLLVSLSGKLLRIKRNTEAKLTSYECGEESAGSSYVSFNPRFYLIALFFVLFEAEIIFLFPWTAVFGDRDTVALFGNSWHKLVFTEVMVFLIVMLAGLAYVWKKEFLEWEKPENRLEKRKFPVSEAHYDAYNKRH